MMLEKKLQKTLQDRKKNYLYRSRQATESVNARYLDIQGKTFLNFSNNNYLGLANHHDVICAFKNATEKYGVGSGSAYLLTGYTNSHQKLEEELAEFLDFPKVLLFSSGYLANLSIASVLMQSQDAIFADKCIHASLIDGCALSKAKLYRYPHCNIDKLKLMFSKNCKDNNMIMTEGVFSMDGSIAPLPEITRFCEEKRLLFYLDDAHGIGVLGKQGRGTLEYYGISHKDCILVGTLGKAFGTYGAFVASNEQIHETLIQYARPYIFTTALPPAIADASRMSLKIIHNEPWRREKLFELIHYFRSYAGKLNLDILDSSTPIQGILLGSNFNTLKISQCLYEKKILAKPILPPTVPVNTSRLRISLTCLHEKEDIQFLLENLHEITKNL